MRFFAFNEGMVKPFRIKEPDGTDKDLTGMTVTWKFSTRAGVITSITGVLSAPTTGQCTFTIPAAFFQTVVKYTCQINLDDGASYDEDTDPFIVDVTNPTQRTS